MKERIKEAVKVIFMIGVPFILTTLLYVYEERVNAPNKDILSTTTQVVQPEFMGKSAKDGLEEALKYYDIKNPEIVYAQAILETGHFKSQVCLRDNNLFGLYNSYAKRYHVFGHWTESVVAYKKWIQGRYKPPNDYYKFLEEISYASDSLYIRKLKQIVKQNEKRRSIGACSSDSSSLCTSSIPNRVR